MSERKVLNVSTKFEANDLFLSRVTSLRVWTLILWLYDVLEILSAGLRSVEDPAYETGEKSPVHRTTDGSVQHEM